MNIYPTLCVDLPKAVRGLTLGNFDGVHLGHTALLDRLRSLLPPGGQTFVYTFSNHPSHILSHLTPIPYIYTLEHKCKLLKEAGVDGAVVTPFTPELAQTPFDRFLTELKEALDFSLLVLGEDARFGKNREGDPEKTRQLAEALGFEVVYITKQEVNDNIVSSARIRTLIAEGDLKSASRYLGRAYSIYAPVNNGTMDLKGLCLPPTGTYRGTLNALGKLIPVEARLHRQDERLDGLPRLSDSFAELVLV